MGIVARVATVLAEHQVNIEDIDQKILAGELFAMTLLADRAACPLELPELTEKLRGSVADLGLEVTVHDAELFRAMHRV